MIFLLFGCGWIVLCGFAALLPLLPSRWSGTIAVVGIVGGSMLGLPSAVSKVLGGTPELASMVWSIPGGTLSVALDALSGFFLVPIYLVCTLAAFYGLEYLRSSPRGNSLGVFWCSYNLLMVSMIVVILAKNGILFLLAWETMALTSFFLVTFENERPEVQAAGWIYLVATHLGTAFLLVLFLFLGEAAGSYDFDRFPPVVQFLPSGGLFLLALVGFGTKAGFVPFHVWLPEAHPAAPSHVSAVMSGLMIKTGIYGLVRIVTLLGPPSTWWGVLLVGLGVSSGILGVLFALAQHDLKRLLAYHSVENIGIILTGLGLGLLGLSLHLPALAALGFAGGLLHVLNHALFKSLLFLSAGAVAHATGTRELDQLGGLAKRMPVTCFFFLIGAAAISGLPPLNGFISEFLIYLGAFSTVTAHSALVALGPALVAVAGLALIGGFAAACFTKAFGIVFLGEPRDPHTPEGHEPGALMLVPMGILALSCVGIGIFPAGLLPAMETVVASFTLQTKDDLSVILQETVEPLLILSLAALLFLSLAGGFVVLRRRLLRRRPVEETVTWDCGYAQPTPRMQSSASSFAQPFVARFAIFLRTRHLGGLPKGFFPRMASLSTKTPDVFRQSLYAPLFLGIEKGLHYLQVLQRGRVQVYVLYIVLALVALLTWTRK